MNIGERIKQLRKQIGISPEKLGDKSDVSGAYIRRLESGDRHSITLDTAQKLVTGFRALGLDIDASDLLEKEHLPERTEPTTFELLNALQKKLEEQPIIDIKVIGTIPGHYPFAIDKAFQTVRIAREQLSSVQNMETIIALTVQMDMLAEGVISGDYLIIDKADTEPLNDKLYVFTIGNEVHAGRTRGNKVLYENRSIDLKGIRILGRVILSVRSREF